MIEEDKDATAGTVNEDRLQERSNVDMPATEAGLDGFRAMGRDGSSPIVPALSNPPPT